MPTTGCNAEIKQNFNCGAVQPIAEIELRLTAENYLSRPNAGNAMLSVRPNMCGRKKELSNGKMTESRSEQATVT